MQGYERRRRHEPSRRIVIEPLDPGLYRDIVRRALDEDIGDGDVTTERPSPPAQRARGVFLVKADCVLAGLDVAFEAFRQLEPACRVTAQQSTTATAARAGEEIAEVVGSAARAARPASARRSISCSACPASRPARAQFVDAAGGRITVLDTRKTTPTLRVLEKYAVRAGGATNHRAGLFDAILIKDNHVRLAGGVEAAVERTRAASPGPADRGRSAEPAQVDEALDAGADIDPGRQPDARRHSRSGRAARAAARKIEISGGVTLDRMPELAATGADFVSVGALTHSAPAVDISFEIEPL